MVISVGLNNHVILLVNNLYGPAAIGASSKALQRLFPLFGFILAIPHFVFGIVTHLIYLREPLPTISKICFADLLGGSLGCLALVFIMESWGYPSLLSFLIVVLLIPATLSLKIFRPLKLVVSLSLLILSIYFLLDGISRFEPLPDLRALGRDHKNELAIKEYWADWTSSSRFSLIQTASKFNSSKIVVLNRGEGHVTVPSFRTPAYSNSVLVGILDAIGIPESALVLFGGVGRDGARVQARSGWLEGLGVDG